MGYMTDDYKPGNPQYHVDSLMEGAVLRVFENIWDDINNEKITREQARRALERNWDLGDYFDEWWGQDNG
jgi:hypothetical protein